MAQRMGATTDSIDGSHTAFIARPVLVASFIKGSAGLLRFWQLDLDTALARDPQAGDKAGRRLVRLIAVSPR